MLSVLFGLAALAAGGKLSNWVWSREKKAEDRALEPLEAAASAMTLGLAVAVAIGIGLGLLHAFYRRALLGAAAALATWAAPGFARRLRPEHGSQPRNRTDGLIVIAALVPLGIFVLYIVCRTARLFVLNPDALAYHMPRAVMIARSGSLFGVDGPDVRIAMNPPDYEVLLAEILAIDREDTLTGWLSPASFIAFLVAVGAMAQRWWGRGLHVVVSVLAAAAMPVAILHAGAHKNDLMVGTLIVVTSHFAGRWACSGGAANLLLIVVGLALAAGTKVTGILLGAALAPIFIWTAVSELRGAGRLERSARRLVISVAIVAFLLLGPILYLHNLVTSGRPLGYGAPDAEAGWGDLANLWRFPYLAFAMPFSARSNAVWVPWDHRYWTWLTNDLFFSTYGVLGSICAFAAPIGFWLSQTTVPERQRERLTVFCVLAATFLLVLPTKIRPLGMFATFTRYTLFFPPVLMMWTLAPAVRTLAGARGSAGAAAHAAPFAMAAWFGYQAVNLSLSDMYAPFSAFVIVLRNPELRRRVWSSPMRAASVADELAGPDDAIAFEGSYDSWSYPLFGADLRRPVTYLHSNRTGFAIRGDARWVVIDRAWRIWFGNPRFHTFADWVECFGRGTPSDADLKVFRMLQHDPRYKLVYHLPQANQAVFMRLDAGSTKTPPG